MNYIIGINGVDRSGKSSLIKRIKNNINNIYEPPNALELSDMFPRSNIKEWYKTTHPSEIVSALLYGNKVRNELVLKNNSQYSVLDRSYLTVFSACIAQFMSKCEVTFEEAKEKVEYINSNFSYKEISNIGILLDMPFSTEESIELIKKRGEEVDKDYMIYLKNFMRCIDSLSKEYDVLYRIDATQSLDDIEKEVMIIIEGNTCGVYNDYKRRL